MNIKVREMTPNDLESIIEIWNEVVESGLAFPQSETFDLSSGEKFFNSQSYVGVAEEDGKKVVGVYILHPNFVGRCSHISNASYAVKGSERGKHIGEMLVRDCLMIAKKLGFSILQLNAVVASNIPALKLYEKIGFTRLGVITNGFLRKDGTYEDIIPHYITL